MFGKRDTCPSCGKKVRQMEHGVVCPKGCWSWTSATEVTLGEVVARKGWDPVRQRWDKESWDRYGA